MIGKVLSKVFGTAHEREMKRLQPIVDKINGMEAGLEALSNEDLQAKTTEFRERFGKGETIDDLLPEAFAVCREASKRILAMRPYDVQLIGGIVLHRGDIAEMKTGEGKTLVATLPLYLNGITGRGAHLVTVNDYLAKRDAEWMGQLYKFLGLSVGIIVHDLSDEERKAAYGCDITYGTNNEFGFDYLRDNMKFESADFVQREYNFAIVDECDSILIDEARTPLIISGPSEESVEKYYEINKIIPKLVVDVDFTMEEKSKTVSLTEDGNGKLEELLGINNLYDIQNIELVHYVYQGLKAHYLYKLDVDYMVKDGEVVIIDEFTGRLMPGRRWSDGLHQAIDAKEGVEIRGENQTLATITFQNYFRMYNCLSGMTGTAETEAPEFKKIYDLDVWVIPTNKPITRLDLDDVVFKTEKAKYKAMVEDIRERAASLQPILVGTISIEKSEVLSQWLKKEGVSHNVLNAKHHEREAEIVAQAGRRGRVTIATNMAGRGTDIKLGGNPEAMAQNDVKGDVEDSRYPDLLKKYEAQVELEKAEVIEAGGLYIMGTERHESRRIDNQLRGRSGRQGDPGASRFYLSLEDDLMRIFNGERIKKIMNTLNVPEDEPITAGMVTRAIEGAQKKVEGHQFDVRKHLLEYDDVMNQQRNAIYELRRVVLRGEGLDRLSLDMLGDVTSQILDVFADEGAKPKDWNLEGMKQALLQQFGLALDLAEKENLTSEVVTDEVSAAVKGIYDKQRESIGDLFAEIQKMILLQTIDVRWKDHLQLIDKLKEGINLRAYAQKDPLIEYKKEAFKAFETMNMQVKAEVIEKLLKIQLVSEADAQRSMRANQRELSDSEFDYSGADDSGGPTWNQGLPAAQGMPSGSSGEGSGMEMSHSDQDSDEGLSRAEKRRRQRSTRRRRR